MSAQSPYRAPFGSAWMAAQLDHSREFVAAVATIRDAYPEMTDGQAVDHLRTVWETSGAATLAGALIAATPLVSHATSPDSAELHLETSPTVVLRLQVCRDFADPGSFRSWRWRVVDQDDNVAAESEWASFYRTRPVAIEYGQIQLSRLRAEAAGADETEWADV